MYRGDFANDKPAGFDSNDQPDRDTVSYPDYPHEPTPALILARARWRVALDYALGWRNEQRARRGVR